MIEPLDDRVVVKPCDEVVDPSAIIIPDGEKDTPIEGIVIAVGPGFITPDGPIPTRLKVDDKILYSKFAGVEVTYEGEEFLIMRESEIFAVLKG